ncbi:MAG: hypothetical protein M3N26_11040, partial [Pseudomonadota bacterium]|nr:hypothetical protein [Pseudomonadota bacterium]
MIKPAEYHARVRYCRTPIWKASVIGTYRFQSRTTFAMENEHGSERAFGDQKNHSAPPASRD